MPAQRGQITGDSREGGESSRTHEYSANCRTFQLKSVLGEGEGEQRGRRGGEISIAPLSCWAKRRRKMIVFTLDFPRQLPWGRRHHSSPAVPSRRAAVALPCYFDFPSRQQWRGKKGGGEIGQGFPREVWSSNLNLLRSLWPTKNEALAST